MWLVIFAQGATQGVSKHDAETPEDAMEIACDAVESLSRRSRAEFPNPVIAVVDLEHVDGLTKGLALYDLELVNRKQRKPIPKDDYMVPIGGGNPYYHCKYCGVTNVQLNMGKHSRDHDQNCPAREF